MIPALLVGLALSAPAAAALPPPGTYGMRLTTATLADLPFIGETKGSSTSWLLVEVAQGPGGTTQQHRTCAVHMGGVGGGRSEVPEAFLVHLGQPRYPLALRDGAYVADMGPSHVGWDPGAAARVPRSVDEPGVIDWDEDGQPGATIRLRLPIFGQVDLFVAQSAHMVLTAAPAAADVPPDRVVGTVAYRLFDQRTIGGTHPRFAASPPMRPDVAASSFAMAPVPADTTCQTLEPRLRGILGE